jgi:hypothetical protein
VTDLNSLLIKKTGIFTKRCSKEDKERSQSMKEKKSTKRKRTERYRVIAMERNGTGR